MHRRCFRALGLALWASIAIAAAASPARAADYTGIVHARHQLALSVATPGIVAAVPVVPGQRVRAGQILLQLDDRLQALEEARRRTLLEDRSELQAIEERLKIVQPLAEDARRLVGTKGALSREEAARTELDFVATRGRQLQLMAQELRERSELDAAVHERGQRRLQAPVDGVVTKLSLSVGEWARPGETAVELVDASVLHVRLNVPAVVARALRAGQPLMVSFDPVLSIKAIKGQLGFVSPAVDAASGLVELRVRVDNPDGRIPPGIKAQVRIEPGAPP